MKNLLNEFQKSIATKKIDTENKFFHNILYNLHFYYWIDNQIEKNILQLQNNSKIIIIDEYQEGENIYYIVCFDYNLIICNQAQESNLLLKHNDSKHYFLKNQLLFGSNSFLADSIFMHEIKNFSSKFQIINRKFIAFWKSIVNCISGFLIKKAYDNSKSNDKFNEIQETIEKANQCYVSLREIGNGSSARVELIYYIKMERIFALKIPFYNKTEQIEKERENYLEFQIPFISKYYGYFIESDSPGKRVIYLLIEFIDGQTLDKYDQTKLSLLEKVNIVFTVILTINYFHSKEYVYRDLHMNNIIINKDKEVKLIDLDRLIKINKQQTHDFYFQNVPPEVKLGQIFTYKSDIYLLGHLIYFLLFKNNEISNQKDSICIPNEIISIIPKEELLEDVFKRCLCKDPKKRPTIFHLILKLYFDFLAYIPPQGKKEQDLISFLEEYVLSSKEKDECMFLAIIYSEDRYISRDPRKTYHYSYLAAEQNNPYAQYMLGLMYYKGRDVPRDIEKAVKYFELSANQNNIESQYLLGIIYTHGINNYYNPDGVNYYYFYSNCDKTIRINVEFGLRDIKSGSIDIKKAICYFTLAADQGHVESQYKLGEIYYLLDSPSDIYRAIHYFELAANQGYLMSLYYLGIIYFVDSRVPCDIHKAIHYFTLAAKHNHVESLYDLGIIYEKGEYVQKDIKKAISYFELAAKQGDVASQYHLALCYCFKSDNVPMNINKAIHYFSLAAKQNYERSFFWLGNIYFVGWYIEPDYNKAFYYLTQAAKNNDSDSQYYLGFFYLEGIIGQKSIDEAIHYFELAAKQNHQEAIFQLGYIYDVYIPGNTNKSIEYFTQIAKIGHKKAQFNLAAIYYFGKGVPHDLNRAYFYCKLAADQNLAEAQNLMGHIYYEGIVVPRDINKAIYYYTLAAEQNFSYSLTNLGLLYFKGEDVKNDYEKAIHYFSLAAKQNDSTALYYLGNIFLDYYDLDKAVDYFLRAAKNNHRDSQYMLGMIYYYDAIIDNIYNINKSIYFFSLAAEQNVPKAQFALGCIYYEGLYVNYDIQKAIHYFKEASCFNHQCAKNNLGVIYKTVKEAKRNIYDAIEYFEEAISQKDDAVAMFNLAHIYFYEEVPNSNIERAIELLYKASQEGIIYSLELLSLAIIKKYVILNNHEKIDSSKMVKFFRWSVLREIFRNSTRYQQLYDDLKEINLVYYMNKIENQTRKKRHEIKDKRQKINSLFYEGLGNI